MKWTEIDHDGTTIYATDFLDGVLVTIDDSVVGWRGWQVVDRGDMDGPQLRKRPQLTKKGLSFWLEEE